MTMTTGAIPRKPNTGAPKFEADPMNSTFRWEMYLTPGRQGNKVPILDGYSKGFGYENTNKVELLYKKLINPLLPYLIKCDAIIIYEQKAGLPKDLHPVRLELLPTTYKAFDWVNQTIPILDFLEAYYAEYRRTGTMSPIEDRRKNVRQAFYDPGLDHSKYNFRTHEELNAFCCDPARIAKHSAKCMEIWYYRHAEFQPELFEHTTQYVEALAHAKNIAKNDTEATAAANTLNQLINNGRWKSNR